MKIVTQNSKAIEQLYNRHLCFQKKAITEKVSAIIDDVRANGDDALIKYTKKFDGVKLTPKQLRVAEGEISGAYQNITGELIENLKLIINNVTLFYKKQQQKGCCIRSEDGVILKEVISPLDTVGIYIPAGTAPLVSTVYMTVIPAKVAGVKRIVICTPPGKNGQGNGIRDQDRATGRQDHRAGQHVRNGSETPGLRLRRYRYARRPVGVGRYR